jgi:Vitamin B6 photo-protection and homoeostasis
MVYRHAWFGVVPEMRQRLSRSMHRHHHRSQLRPDSKRKYIPVPTASTIVSDWTQQQQQQQHNAYRTFSSDADRESSPLIVIQYPSNDPYTSVSSRTVNESDSNDLRESMGDSDMDYNNDNNNDERTKYITYVATEYVTDVIHKDDLGSTESSSSSSLPSTNEMGRWKRLPKVSAAPHSQHGDTNRFVRVFTIASIQRTLYNTILIHFVPTHYPQSVQQPGYTQYALYTFMASIAGSASMVFSTQILLSTMMMNTTTTTMSSTTPTTAVATAATTSSITATAATAGALNWVLKDGIGQLGGIMVASQMGQYRAFDNNPKRYRMYSALLLDLAALIELCTPVLCATFSTSIHSPITYVVLPLACTATICKNIAYIMASASRATLHQSLCINHVLDPISTNKTINGDGNMVETKAQSKVPPMDRDTTILNNNLADVTAKFGSQSTAAGLIGTIIGIAFSASTTWNVAALTSSSDLLMTFQEYYAVIGFTTFVFTHQICNYIALRNVALHHFNRQRLCIVLQNYVQQLQCNDNLLATDGATLYDATVLTPAKVAAQETFLPRIFYPFRPIVVSDDWLTIGCGLLEICPYGSEQLQQLLLACPSEQYVINIAGTEKGKCKDRVQLVFLEQATCTDILRGMLHAYLLQKRLLETPRHWTESGDSRSCTSWHLQMIANSHDHLHTLFPLFHQHLRANGWNTHTIYVEEGLHSFRFALKFRGAKK